jgi:hypothetical protein
MYLRHAMSVDMQRPQGRRQEQNSRFTKRNKVLECTNFTCEGGATAFEALALAKKASSRLVNIVVIYVPEV